MSLKHLITMLFLSILIATPSLSAQQTTEYDSEGYPVLYVMGECNGWNANDNYRFTRSGDHYSITLSNLDGKFKIADRAWNHDLGANTTIEGAEKVTFTYRGPNAGASNLKNVTISFSYPSTNGNPLEEVDVTFSFATDPTPDPNPGEEPSLTDQYDSEGYPYFYILASFTSWQPRAEYRFSRSGSTYTISLSNLNGEFKISDCLWGHNFGGNTPLTLSGSATENLTYDGENITASDLKNVVITFDYTSTNGEILPSIVATFTVDGETPGPRPVEGLSGTLPVLYINAYKVNDDGSFVLDGNGNKVLENEIIDKDLAHKNYFTAEYWLDINDCQWMIDLGAKSVGSADAPLATQIKARGNYTRTGFSKKPFKLKLDKKQDLLCLTPKKSKHYALLAHADDTYGYLRNFTGFNLGDRIGLPWTPDQQPVEVVINGDYRGLYFLTESIRVGDGRVPIVELKDNVTDPDLISGGYLVELDNYDEENQIRMEEKSCASGHYLDMLRITFDTPEEYSPIQRRFVEDQFSTMNDLVGRNSDDLWRYIDLDDAARYYIVKEIICDVESYHGSTYLYRDFGAEQKWHFSPLWDCGNAFNGSTNDYLYNGDPFGNTWIPSFRENNKFNNKVVETWKWFMSSCYDGIVKDIDTYVDHLRQAAKADRARWKNASAPSGQYTSIADNTDMTSRRNAVVDRLNAKINWLRQQWGDFAGTYSEPQRDTTPCAPLPEYVSGVENVAVDSPSTAEEYYDLYGRRVINPSAGIYILRQGGKTSKVMVK